MVMQFYFDRSPTDKKFRGRGRKTCFADHNEILHTPRQLHCRASRVQDFVVVGIADFKLEHSKFW